MKDDARPLTRSLTLIAALALPPSVQATAPIRAGGVELVIQAESALQGDPAGTPWREWLLTSLDAARLATGDFPRQRVIIDLRAAPGASHAIAFGQIRRGQPPRIRFWVSPGADLASLRSDWRSYHEFAHLLIPFPGNRDIWFTEGLASYYQYILQSRAGLISERAAWERLLAGFRRGMGDAAGRGRTLRQLSPEMWRERAFKRVYWTGAAFFLRVDTRVRTDSRGKPWLDRALARFHDCCLADQRRWNAYQLVERLGALSIPSIWAEEYRRSIDARAEPDIGEALALLGIELGASGSRFDPAPEASDLRNAIAGPRRAAPQPK